MAKITGALSSEKAHGSISKILTFSKKRSGQQTRKYNRPMKDPSGQQLERRILNEYATAMWRGMSAADKATWETQAKATRSNLPTFNYFLSQALSDIETVMKITVFWPFVYSINTTIKNTPNSNYNGTITQGGTGALPSRTDHLTKKRRYCFSFTGQLPYVYASATPHPKFIYTEKYSWIMFFKLTYKITQAPILLHRQGGTSGYYFTRLPSGFFAFYNGKTLHHADIRSPLTTDNWTHIIFTYDGSGGGTPTIKAYYNGQEVTLTSTIAEAFVTTSEIALYCGTPTGAGQSLFLMSDFVYLNRLITKDEAAILSNYAFNAKAV